MSDGFCGIVRRCNALLFSGGLSRSTFFVVNGRRVGLVREDILEHLKKHPEVFTLKPPTGPNEKPQLHLSDSLKTPEERTMAVEGLLKKLRTEDQFICLRGWRNERYDAKVRFSEPPLFAVERAAACLFGLNQYGTHCNVYTKDEDGKLLMWIARRSPTKPTFPGKLDNLCAGGLASGLGVRECMVKECQEEAAVPLHYTDRLIACGTVSYLYEDERGIHPETQFVYDLEVPSDFKPVNTDGEVAEFRLVSLEEVKQLIVTTEFKPNCALVILDFLVRHGFVTPENEPNYPYLVELMHYPLQRLFDQD